jgi:hypothetical protein
VTLWAVSATTSSERLAVTSHLSSIWAPGSRVNLVMPEHHPHRAPVRRVVPYVPPGVGRPAEAIEGRSARQLGRPRNRETH